MDINIHIFCCCFLRCLFFAYQYVVYLFVLFDGISTSTGHLMPAKFLKYTDDGIWFLKHFLKHIFFCKCIFLCTLLKRIFQKKYFCVNTFCINKFCINTFFKTRMLHSPYSFPYSYLSYPFSDLLFGTSSGGLGFILVSVSTSVIIVYTKILIFDVYIHPNS